MNSEDIFISSIWKLIGALLCFLFLATLLTDGMFVDGLWYATISRNLAMGQGSWFLPQFTQTLHPQFFEHPPMLFWIQSLFYKILGDQYWVERVFCIVILLKTIFTLNVLWDITAEDQVKNWFCIPILALILFGEVHRGYGNNLMEPLMTLFCLWSVIFQYYSLKAKNIGEQIIYISLAGASLIFAFLTKGPTGLFPLAFLPIHLLITGQYHKRNILGFIYLILSLIIFSILTYLLAPGLIKLIIQYFDQQVISALEGNRLENIQSTRWGVLRMLIPAIILFITIPILFHWAIRKEFRLKLSNSSHNSLILISLGICASLPLMISIKQASYYLIPSLPFFALGISQIVLYGIKFNIKSSYWIRIFHIITWVLLIAGLAYSASQIGKIDRRDKELLTAIDEIASKIPDTIQTIDFCCPEKLEGSLHGFFYRYHFISIDESESFVSPYLITSQYHPVPSNIKNYTLIEMENNYLELWKKNVPFSH